MPIVTADLTERRERLVEQLQRQGIRDELVLAAMRVVPWEAFLPDDLEEFAYQNTALPIAKKQTISQPLVVAMMTDQLLDKLGCLRTQRNWSIGPRIGPRTPWPWERPRV